MTDQIREELILEHPLAYRCEQECKEVEKSFTVHPKKQNEHARLNVSDKPFGALKQIWTHRTLKRKSNGPS